MEAWLLEFWRNCNCLLDILNKDTLKTVYKEFPILVDMTPVRKVSAPHIHTIVFLAVNISKQGKSVINSRLPAVGHSHQLAVSAAGFRINQRK